LRIPFLLFALKKSNNMKTTEPHHGLLSLEVTAPHNSLLDLTAHVFKHPQYPSLGSQMGVFLTGESFAVQGE
jgi:hypothetical protein